MTKSRMIRTAAGLVAAFATMCLLSAEASAQSCGFGGNAYRSVGYGGGYYGGGGYGGGYYGGGGYGGGFYGRGPSISFQRVSTYRIPAHTYHDTSHYDYHPGRFVPHGNHFDYVPGHYNWHQTGHVHHNH